MLPTRSYTLFVAFHVFVLSFSSQLVSFTVARDGSDGGSKPPARSSTVDIGVVIDLNSPSRTMTEWCMSTARSDFYINNSHYRTRLSLHLKHAGNVFDATTAVLGLLKQEKVHGIVGLQIPEMAAFAAEVSQKAHVPILPFFPNSPIKSPYLIHIAIDDSYRVEALIAIFQKYSWGQVVVFYEDTEPGNQFVSHLNEPFQKLGVRLSYMAAISPSSKDDYIVNQLKISWSIVSRVFIVHVVNPSLGIRIFSLARDLGMMSEGYAWITTDTVSNFVDSMDSSVMESMEGVLGIRPYVPQSRNLENFQQRWREKVTEIKNTGKEITDELNVQCLWAYDTISALARAAENTGLNPSFSGLEHRSDVGNILVSKFGPKLLEELSRTIFEGLSGEFKIFKGRFQPPALEIINIVGGGGKGYRYVGYWDPDKGITSGQSNMKKDLKTIIWPGDTYCEPPKLWAPKNSKFKVGIPVKGGFFEFVNAQIDNSTGKLLNVTGFSIEIFLRARDQLGFPLEYEFVPFSDDNGKSNGDYTAMVKKIKTGDFDIVVGDTTITANRTEFADFALPYSESGVRMVVNNRRSINMWSFVEPLDWDLWVTIVAACIFIGITLQILEHREHIGSPQPPVKPHEQLGLQFWFPIAILAFPERNMVRNNWSRFVLVVWLFMAFILMQSYTAKLSAIFTIDQLHFQFNKDCYIGYQKGSFVKDLVAAKLQANESRLIPYTTMEEYHNAMENGTINIIIDEIPYINLFLHKYGNKYRMHGPTYKTDGFGFAFPQDSPLVHHFSRAILAVIQGPNMSQIEESYFSPKQLYGDDDPSITQESPRLKASNFGGLFIIVGSATFFSLFCSVSPLGQKFWTKVVDYSDRFLSFLPLFRRPTRVESIKREDDVGGHSPPSSENDQLASATVGEVQLAGVADDEEETDGASQESVHSLSSDDESGKNGE